VLPTEQFSGDALPQTPWQPQCWSKGAEQLTQEAQTAIWENDTAITHGALGTPGDAFSGTQSAGANESEQGIDPSRPPDGGGRAKTWRSNIKALYATEPLAGTTKPLSWSPAAESPNPPA
jgi:hypothetical protein